MTHNYNGPDCQHWRCGGSDGTVSGWQCADCGHYYPRSCVRMDPDSEFRCRTGMGCDAARHPTLRRGQSALSRLTRPGA